MLACRFGEHRDNSRNSQSVFLVVFKKGRKEMEKSNIMIRLEKKEEQRKVENLVRESFWNIPEMADLPKKIVRTGYSHIVFSVGSIEKVDALTAELKADGYEIISGPRTTCDGYYESCIVAVEDNQIEITV